MIDQEKLTELTQPKSKYLIRENVFCLYNNTIHEFEIVHIKDSPEIKYLDRGGLWWKESELFPTKQSLIESQVKYWQNRLMPKITPEEFENYLKELLGEE